MNKHIDDDITSESKFASVNVEPPLNIFILFFGQSKNKQYVNKLKFVLYYKDKIL